MDSVILDTDIFSFFFRQDTRSLLYETDVREKVRCLSFATVAELRFGALVGNWQEQRRRKLEDSISRTVIIHGDDLTTRHWARIKALRQQLGRPIGSEDCWIAATALRHGLILLTHNSRDYEDIPDLKMISHA